MRRLGLAICFTVLGLGACGDDDAATSDVTTTTDAATTTDTTTATDATMATDTATDAAETSVGPVTGPKLIVTDSQRSTILTYKLDASFTGAVAPAARTTGSLVLRPTALAVNGAGELFRLISVAGVPSGSIEIFADASAVSGDALPVRKLDGDATLLATVAPRSLVIDPQRDLLYVGTSSAGVLVFTGTEAADGNVAPARSFTSADFGNGFSNSVGATSLDVAGDALWAVVSGGDVVQVTEVSTRSGDLAAARKLTGLQAIGGLAYDASDDTLWVARIETLAAGNRVHLGRVDDASTKTGAVAPDAEIHLSGTINAVAFGVLDGAGYLLASEGVLVVDGLATLSGDVAPTRTVTPPANTLETPAAMVLVSE